MGTVDVVDDMKTVVVIMAHKWGVLTERTGFVREESKLVQARILLSPKTSCPYNDKSSTTSKVLRHNVDTNIN